LESLRFQVRCSTWAFIFLRSRQLGIIFMHRRRNYFVPNSWEHFQAFRGKQGQPFTGKGRGNIR
jgi:hypothetical protein